MKHLASRIIHSGWLSLGIGIIAITVVAYGSWRYVTISRSYEDLVRVTKELQDTIYTLEGNLSLTEYEREKLADSLTLTENTLGSLKEETTSLNEKVGTFEKLITLDPELLKKYSKVYFLNEHYNPSTLIAIDKNYLGDPARVLQFHAQAYPFLARMLDAAQEDDLALVVASAYRSFKTQASLKATNKVIYGAGTANQFSADQGYSEHQLGTTVDLTTKTMKSLGQSFEKTREFAWLSAHAHEYGFVLSYPKGNGYYIYEPWHWRFVGVALATALHEQDKTLYEEDQRTIDSYLITLFD